MSKLFSYIAFIKTIYYLTVSTLDSILYANLGNQSKLIIWIKSIKANVNKVLNKSKWDTYRAFTPSLGQPHIWI